MLGGLLTKKVQKKCPRCATQFECVTVDKCWCDDELHLSRESIKKIRMQYVDCLCKKCLQEFVEEEKREGGIMKGNRPSET